MYICSGLVSAFISTEEQKKRSSVCEPSFIHMKVGYSRYGAPGYLGGRMHRRLRYGGPCVSVGHVQWIGRSWWPRLRFL